MFECFVCDGWFPSEKSLSKHHLDVHGLSDGYEDSDKINNDIEQNTSDLKHEQEPKEKGTESKIIEVTTEASEISKEFEEVTKETSIDNENMPNGLDVENEPKRPRRSVYRIQYQDDGIEVDNKDDFDALTKISTFNCHLCENRFIKGSDLVKHMLAEHLMVKYTCQLCQKDCGNPRALTLHYNNLHPQQKVDYKCHICIGTKTYSRLSNLEEHYLRFHLRIPHNCRYCKKNFRSLGSLWVHESEAKCPKIVTKDVVEVAKVPKNLLKQASKTSTSVDDDIEVIKTVFKKHRKLIVKLKRCPFTSALALKRKHVAANQNRDQPKTKKHKRTEQQVYGVESQDEPNDARIQRPRRSATMKPIKDYLTDHEDFEEEHLNNQLSKKSRRSTLKNTSTDQDHEGQCLESQGPRRSFSPKESKADDKGATSLLDLKCSPWSAAGLINFNFTYEDNDEVRERQVQRPIDMKNGQVLDNQEQQAKRSRKSSTLKDTIEYKAMTSLCDLKDVSICEICDEKVHDMSTLSDHYLNIHLNLMLSEHDIICRICDRTFQNNDRLLGHLLFGHLRLKLACDLCGLIAGAPYDLIRHKSKIHEENDEESKQDNETCKIIEGDHAVNETQRPDQETNKFVTDSKANHQIEEIKVVTEEVTEEITEEVTEDAHEITKVTEEVTEDPHEVAEVTKDVLKEVPVEGVQNKSQVQNDHARVEDYLDNCSKVFEKAFNTMRQKEPSETNDFEFLICKLCPRTFDKLEELNNHYLSVHLNMTFPCDICGIADYGNFQYLNLHKKIMHEEMIDPESTTCHLCSSTFGSYEKLTEHLLSFHLEINSNAPQISKYMSSNDMEATEVKIEPDLDEMIESIDNDQAEVDTQEGLVNAPEQDSFDIIGESGIEVVRRNFDITKDSEEDKENIDKSLKLVKPKVSKKPSVKVIRLLKKGSTKKVSHDDKYSCNICSKSHETYWKLCHHVVKEHGKCDYCSIPFNKAMSLYCHQKKVCIAENKWIEKR